MSNKAKAKPKDSGAISHDEALALVQSERTAREGTAQTKITAILKEYECHIEVIEVRRNGNLEQMQIIYRANG